MYHTEVWSSSNWMWEFLGRLRRMFWGTLHLVVQTFSYWSHFSNNTFISSSSFKVPFWENGLNLHMWNFVGSWKFWFSSGKIWYMTIHNMRDGNLMIPPVSWHLSQMVLTMSVTYSSHLYIFPFVTMVSIASNMSNLRSLPRPTRVSVMVIILATISGVRAVIWLIIDPFLFF